MMARTFLLTLLSLLIVGLVKCGIDADVEALEKDLEQAQAKRSENNLLRDLSTEELIDLLKRQEITKKKDEGLGKKHDGSSVTKSKSLAKDNAHLKNSRASFDWQEKKDAKAIKLLKLFDEKEKKKNADFLAALQADKILMERKKDALQKKEVKVEPVKIETEKDATSKPAKKHPISDVNVVYRTFSALASLREADEKTASARKRAMDALKLLKLLHDQEKKKAANFHAALEADKILMQKRKKDAASKKEIIDDDSPKADSKEANEEEAKRKAIDAKIFDISMKAIKNLKEANSRDNSAKKMALKVLDTLQKIDERQRKRTAMFLADLKADAEMMMKKKDAVAKKSLQDLTTEELINELKSDEASQGKSASSKATPHEKKAMDSTHKAHNGAQVFDIAIKAVSALKKAGSKDASAREKALTALKLLLSTEMIKKQADPKKRGKLDGEKLKSEDAMNTDSINDVVSERIFNLMNDKIKQKINDYLREVETTTKVA